MAEDQPEQGTKRWLGYVCPECRMIFRVEVGHGGRRAQCPGCQALVILGGKAVAVPEARTGDAGVPAKGDGAPGARVPERPDPEPLTRLDAGGPGAGPDVPGREGRSGRKRLKKRKGIPKEPVWEKKKKKIEGMSWAMPVMLMVFLVALGAGVAYWARSVAGWGTGGGVLVRRTGIGEPEEDPVTGMEPALEMDVLVGDVTDAVTRFLGAESVDALLETVRDRERLDPVIRRVYADGYQPTPVRQIAPRGGLQTLGELYSVVVEMEDFSQRPIAVEKTERGFLVDWESWVGHSDMPWKEFMRTRPTEPATFRVKTQRIEYYNFAFSDDKKWQAFRLESPDGEQILYGYVPRYSMMDALLKPLDPRTTKSTHTVMLRYPDGAGRPDQVLIERVIASGWVLTDTKNTADDDLKNDE